jgi:hypothetical protein
MFRLPLILDQINYVTFVMLDASADEVAGLADTFTVEVSKTTGAFAASAATKGEKGNGWYYAILPAAECDTRGPLDLAINGAGCIQQNLAYFVGGATANAVEKDYIVKETGTLNPIEGAEVTISTDVAGNVKIWEGISDALGHARDEWGQKPWLDPGTYYFWVQKAGYTFDIPDTEVVS